MAAGARALEPAVRALASAELARPPGSAFEYSNPNYTVLGLAVEMAAGEPFDAYLKAHIFGPLQMHRTYTSVEDASRGGLARGYRYWFGCWSPSTFLCAAPCPLAVSSPPPRT